MFSIKKRLLNSKEIQFLLLKRYWKKSRLTYRLKSDTQFAIDRYKEKTGKVLNLDNPRTFDEKLWYLKLYNRNPLLTKCSDKYLVREYVKECGLEHILYELYAVYDNAKDIDFNRLPDKAFIKCNHTSGYNIIWDRNKPFNKRFFIKKFNFMLKQNYYYASREWNYKNIDHKLICEKILNTDDKLGLIDYRMFCFNGECKIVAVDIGTCSENGEHSGKAKRNIYDKNFDFLNVKISRDGFDNNLIKKPKNYELMVQYAEKLSKPFPFVRVDFYNIDGKIYFGEMTFYHQGGCNNIEPEEWSYKLGDWIDISHISRVKN